MISKFFIDRPVFASVLILSLTVVGACASLEVKRWVCVTSTTVVIRLPSRSMTNGVGPLALRTASTISSGLCTSVAPTLTITSPLRMPANAAGP